MRDRWFFAFFVVSGFCALLCQVVWLRLAMARFGVTAAMIAIVVSVFMAGLALGNGLGGRLVDRARGARRALYLYAACELTIALSSQVVPALLAAGRSVLGGQAWGSATYHLACALWVTLALLPFCVAMGATLPLALAAIGPRVRHGRSSVGHLYAANVLGAALGTLSAAFVLIELYGLRGTLDVGAALNAGLAAGSLALSLRAGAATENESAAPATAGAGDRVTLLALFGTGFASMAMEVVWVRQFAPLLGNVVYAFALILAAYLLATLAGSLLYRARSAALPAAGPPAWAWLAMAVFSMLPAVAADPRLPISRFGATMEVPLRSIAAVGLAVAPLSAALGFVTPWLVDLWSGGAARRAGTAWAINGAGSIVGPLFGGFLLLPWVGERPALLLLALVLVGIGLFRGGRAAWAPLLGATAAAAAIAALTRGEEARFPDAHVRRDSTATTIVAGQGFQRQLYVNGISMTSLTPITKFMCHLPLAFRQRPPQRGLVICFGMGTSFRSMSRWGIETTAVELVPSVPRFFGEFHADAAAVLASPRARVVVDDGRRFLDRTVEQFDAVVVDPPPPVEAAGSSLLYSREFYRSVRPHLAPDGILQAWIPSADPSVVAAFVLALHQEFPHVRAFTSVEGWGIHLLASTQPIPRASAAELVARMPAAARADLVEWGPYATPEEQLDHVLRREIVFDWDALARVTAPLTDDRPLNEYYFLRRWRR